MAQASMRRLVRAIAARTHKGHSLMKVRAKLYASAERACLNNDFTIDWLQSLKPSELDWLQVYDMTH